MPDFVATMRSRLLAFTRDGANFRAIVETLAGRTQDLHDATQAVISAFGLETSTGAQLDTIGSLFQRPRLGADDDIYRRILRARILLTLSSGATAETLLGIVQALTGHPAPEYEEHYPAQFSIAAQVATDEIDLLRNELRLARAWGVLGALVVYPAADTLRGDVLLLDGGPVANPGNGDVVPDDGGPVIDSYPTAMLTEI